MTTGIEDLIAAGNGEVETFPLIIFKKSQMLTHPACTGFIAVTEKDTGLRSQFFGVKFTLDFGILNAVHTGITEPDGETTHDVIHSHAAAAHDINGKPVFIIAGVPAHPVHGLVVLDLIFQHVVKLLFGQSPITAVQGVNDIEADIAVRGNKERLVHIVICRGLRQFKGQHLDGDRNRSDGSTIAHHRNSALVKTGSLSFFRVNSEEELLECAFVQGHGLERGGILEVGLHALERFEAAVRGVTITVVHFPGRSQPEIGF